jgi:hypothetical protein
MLSGGTNVMWIVADQLRTQFEDRDSRQDVAGAMITFERPPVLDPITEPYTSPAGAIAGHRTEYARFARVQRASGVTEFTAAAQLTLRDSGSHSLAHDHELFFRFDIKK